MREFAEETGVSSNLQPINTWPIVDSYKADNDFIYETRYWVVKFAEEAVLPYRFQSYEVKTRAWKSGGEVESIASTSQLNVFHEAKAQLFKN
jgi:hypothetical protein